MMRHVMDRVMDDISYLEIITTTICNEPVRDKKAVEKVFNEILEMKLLNAKEMFKVHMSDILKEIKRRTNHA